MEEWPEACPKCGVEAKLRKFCEHCQKPVYVIEHLGTHYMGGGAHEIVPCFCQTLKKYQNDHLRYEKQKRKEQRDSGKVIPSKKPPAVTTPEMARKAAEGIAGGQPIYQALKAAGFPEGTAKNGRASINRMIRGELKSLGRKYIDAARDLTPEDQELLVRGQLMEAVILRQDKGVQAAKQLGADKRVAMWTPDSQVGMVILQAPVMPKIDPAIPIIETRYQKECAMLEMKNQEEEHEEHYETPSPEPDEVPSEAEVWEEEEKKVDPNAVR